MERQWLLDDRRDICQSTDDGFDGRHICQLVEGEVRVRSIRCRLELSATKDVPRVAHLDVQSSLGSVLVGHLFNEASKLSRRQSFNGADRVTSRRSELYRNQIDVQREASSGNGKRVTSESIGWQKRRSRNDKGNIDVSDACGIWKKTRSISDFGFVVSSSGSILQRALNLISGKGWCW